MNGKILYSPSSLNKAFKDQFNKLGWFSYKEPCEYTYGDFLAGYKPSRQRHQLPFREMDFVKSGIKLGIEVKF